MEEKMEEKVKEQGILTQSKNLSFEVDKLTMILDSLFRVGMPESGGDTAECPPQPNILHEISDNLSTALTNLASETRFLRDSIAPKLKD